MCQFATRRVVVFVALILFGCSKGEQPISSPTVAPVVSPLAMQTENRVKQTRTRSNGNGRTKTLVSEITFGDAAKLLLEDKSLASLKVLLELNGEDASTIHKIGGAFEWPRKVYSGDNDIVHDVKMVTSQGKKFIASVCSHVILREPEFARLGPIKADQAFVFTPEGSLVSAFGNKDRDCNVVVLSLGCPDIWFIWVQKTINERTTVESDIYLIGEPLVTAVRLRHPINGTGYTSNEVLAKQIGHTFFYRDNNPKGTQVDLTTGLGRDGKRYPRTLQWDREMSVFRGAGRLESASGVIFEVTESVSKRFVATDAGK